MTSIRDLTIRGGLVVITVDGFEPEKQYATDEHGVRYEVTSSLDLPGSANWLCTEYGMSEDFDAPGGILWTDYDSASDEPWRFSVLLDEDDSETFREMARAAGYEVVKIEPVTEPTNYGDGHAGTIEILKHRDGWVILQ